uniref:Beta-galactosidase n=1 Tax=Ignavibacterium album TaxID=591197 RepID=A0A7V3E5L2_9BACT
MPLKSKFFLLFLQISVLLNLTIYPQIVFRDLPNYRINSADLLFFDITDTRQLLPLNGQWKVFPQDEQEKAVNINVPSVFQGSGEFVFQKKFTLNEQQIKNHKIELIFFGLNYSADISLNKVIIYRHTGGDLPFSIKLPRDILKSDAENVLSVSLVYKLDSENTIPLKQRFFFPQNFGGLIRDVYLHLLPNVNLQKTDITSSVDFKGNKATITVNSHIVNNEFRTSNDTIPEKTNFTLITQIFSPDGRTIAATDKKDFELKRNREIQINNALIISNPILWSPDNPQSYIVRQEIFSEGNLIDRYDQSVAVFTLTATDDKLLLNNQPITLNGVSYIPSFKTFGSMMTYAQMEADIQKIKDTGFNTVRFAKSIPHPYFLKLCEGYGLIPIIELPLANIPEGLANSTNFLARVKNYMNLLLDSYAKYSLFSVLNIGSSFIGKSESHRSFLNNISSFIKSKRKVLVSASFFRTEADKIEGVDLYGIELFNKSINDFENEIKSLQDKIGKGRLFISEATYTASIGQTDGYVNDYSFEAQAKFFEDLLNFSGQNQLAGYYINTMFDLRGDFASLTSGYDEDNVYKIGLISEDRKQERLAYKVISAKLRNAERVTIPIGAKKDDAPMIFIVTGLLLALIMGVLVNSGKKFREDASRALLRPYNFFADVRDQRIISAYHSIYLALVISLVNALIIANVLYFLKTSFFFEKFLLSFGSPAIMSALSYLAWHPFNAIIWLFIITIMILILLMLLIKAAAFFVKTKVYLSSTFFTVIWSFLPIVLLIPVGIVLYRLLNADVANLYIFISLLIIKLWLLYRLIKGIYVIYDVNPSTVYFYSIVFILAMITIVLVYYEVNSSVVENILLTLKQFNII